MGNTAVARTLARKQDTLSYLIRSKYTFLDTRGRDGPRFAMTRYRKQRRETVGSKRPLSTEQHVRQSGGTTMMKYIVLSNLGLIMTLLAVFGKSVWGKSVW